MNAICPLCESRGVVGAACEQPACCRRGYHFVPTEYHHAGETSDPDVGKLVGNYLLVGLLGGGGFGKVYLALQQPIGMRTALKLVRHDILPESADLVRRFEIEAQSLARVSHPNVVRLLHYGFHERAPFMVMEFVEGARTLKSELATRAAESRPLRVEEVRSLLTQLLNGVEAAHDLALIHRDLKPENLMIQAVRGDPLHLKILDFGLAKDLEVGTETSMALGTPAYMAPEQLRKRDLGPWTDLYAIGAIAFELMTGRRVFNGDQSHIVACKLDPAYDPMTAARGMPVPGPVGAFLARALAPHPANRFRDVAAFRAGLDDALLALQRVGQAIDVTALIGDRLTAVEPPATLLPSTLLGVAAPPWHRRWVIGGALAVAVGAGVFFATGDGAPPLVAAGESLARPDAVKASATRTAGSNVTAIAEDAFAATDDTTRGQLNADIADTDPTGDVRVGDAGPSLSDTSGEQDGSTSEGADSIEEGFRTVMMRLGAQPLLTPLLPAAAAWSLETRDGATVTLADLMPNDTLVLVTYWASWAGPCRVDMPSLRRLEHELRDRRFSVVAVSYDSGWEDIRDFLTKHGVARPDSGDAFVTVRDPSEGETLRQKLGTQLLPETYAIFNGRILARFVNAQDWTDPSTVAVFGVLAPARP